MNAHLAPKLPGLFVSAYVPRSSRTGVNRKQSVDDCKGVATQLRGQPVSLLSLEGRSRVERGEDRTGPQRSEDRTTATLMGLHRRPMVRLVSEPPSGEHCAAQAFEVYG